MIPISFSEMEIVNMKRKELQAMCKNHSIPANLTNVEMANRLISLLKVNDKSMAKGKSCMRSALEQASENLSDGVKRLSKKVRFSPENETFEFMASDVKHDEIGRRERAKRRSIMRRVEGIASIVTEKSMDNVTCLEGNVNKPIKVTRSKGKAISNEVENVVKTTGVKKGQKSVAFESVSMIETRVSTRSLKIKEVEKRGESEDDALSWKHQTRRTLRKRGVKMDNEVSEIEVASTKKIEAVNNDVALKKNEVMVNKRIREDERIAETEKVEVVRRGRTKKHRAHLVEDANMKSVASKTECNLDVVLPMEEPLRRSSRYGNRRQSVAPQTEKMSTTLISKGAKAKTVAVSDVILAENDINKKPRNRRGDLVFEEENNATEGYSVVEEPPIRPSRNGKRRHSIMPQTEKAGADGSKGEKGKNILTSSAVEENAKSTRKSSRRKTIAASDLTLAENVRKQKSTSRRMDSILEEENAAIESSSVEERPSKSMRSSRKGNKRHSIMPQTDKAGADGSKGEKGKNISKRSAVEENAKSTRISSRRKSIVASDLTIAENVRKPKSTSGGMDLILEDENAAVEGSLVEKRPRKSTRNDAKVPNALAKDGTVEAVESSIAVAENGSGPIMNSTEDVSENLEEINVPKTSGLLETASDSVKLQKYHEETEGLKSVSGISRLEVLLNINNEDEADKDKVLQDFDSDILAPPEFDVESNVEKNVDFAEASLGGSSSRFDQPDILAKQVQHLDLEREAETRKNYESETRACGSLNFQNDDAETHGMIANEEDSDPDNMALLEPDAESKEDHSRIDQPDCIDENLGLKELQMAENNDMGKHTDLSSAVSYDAIDVENIYNIEEKQFVDPEVVPNNSNVEERTPCEVKGRERHESGKFTDLSGGISHDGVDVENSYAREEKPFVELEGVLDNSSGRNYTPREVEGMNRHGVERSASVSELRKSLIVKRLPSEEPKVDENIEHTLEGSLAQNMGFNSLKDFFEKANEEPKVSCVHITDRKDATPSQNKEIIRDEVENAAIVEPTEGQELANKFDAEGHSAQDKGSVLKENFEIVNDENVDSSLLDTYEQKEITAFQVETKQKDEVDMSASGYDLPECVDSSTPAFIEERETVVKPSQTNEMIRDEVEIAAIVEPTEGEELANKVDAEGYSAQNKGSVLKKNLEIVNEENVDSSLLDTDEQKEITTFQVETKQRDEVDMSASGYDLPECVDSSTPVFMEERETVVEPSQTKEMMRDEVEIAAIVEPTEGEELANKFDAEGYSAQDKGSVLKENLEIVNEENVDSSLLDTDEQKEITTFQVETKQRDEVDMSASGYDLPECVDSSTPVFMEERETVVEPSQTKEMMRDEVEIAAIVEPTEGEELANKFDAEGYSAQDKGSVLKENFEIVSEENVDSSLLDTYEQKEITTFQVEIKQKDEVDISASSYNLPECVDPSTPAFMVERETIVEPSQTKELIRDVVEIASIVEPTEGEELANKFDAEGYSAQDKGSVLKENFEIVNEENVDSSLLDTYEQKEITTFQVETKQKDKVDISASGYDLPECVDPSTPAVTVEKETVVETLVMNSSAAVEVLAVADLKSLEQNIAEGVRSPSVTSRDTALCLKAQNDSIKEATPISVSNEIKSLMMVNLDWTPSSEFRKAHADLIMLQEGEDHFATAEPIDDQNKVIIENSSELRQSPLPHEDSMVADMPSSSFTLCEDIEMEKPETNVFADKLIEFQETCDSSEQSRNQSFGSDCSTEPNESEGTENEFDAGVNKMSAENETQPFEATSPETASGFAVDQGNGSTEIKVLPTELKHLFDDETPRDGVLLEVNDNNDASNEGLLLRNNFATEDEDSKKEVVEEEETRPIEFNDEDTQVMGSFDHDGFADTQVIGSFDHDGFADTQVIGSFDHDGFADTPCIETNTSSSSLACCATASKSFQTINFPVEESKDDILLCRSTGKETVSEMGHDDIAKEINSPGTSVKLADDSALDNATSYVVKADIADKNSEDVTMEDSDTRIHEDPTPVESAEVAKELDGRFSLISDKLTDERKYDDIVNELEGVETQYDDGMFDDLDGDEMEIVQELVRIEKDNSSYSSDQFLEHEEASVEDNSFEEDRIEVKEIASSDMANYASNEISEFEECMKSSEIRTTRADGADESHNLTSNVSDMAQCVDESKEYEEYQHYSKVSQCWSPNPEFGISQSSLESNMFSSWELNLFSEGETTRSAPVGSKVSFTEEEDTGVEAQVNEEPKTCDDAMVELTEQCEGAKVPDSVIEDKSFEFADEAFHGEVSEQAARDMTRCESCPQELSEEGATGTKDAVIQKHSFVDIVQSSDYLDENTEVIDCSQDFSPNAAGDDSTFDASAFDKGFAAEDVEQNSESVGVVNTYGDEKGELASFETTSNILKTEKQSSLIRETPKKLITAFDMKENATSVKRENLGSVTAKSIAKRRALSELHK